MAEGVSEDLLVRVNKPPSFEFSKEGLTFVSPSCELGWRGSVETSSILWFCGGYCGHLDRRHFWVGDCYWGDVCGDFLSLDSSDFNLLGDVCWVVFQHLGS